MNLNTFIKGWKAWARDADRSEEGWETDFPDWPGLVSACKESMVTLHPTKELVEDVGFCWSLCEETEELADFARESLPMIRDIVAMLTRHQSPATRWQAYDVLGDWVGEAAEETLREGFRDPAPYVRRRALLAYGRQPRRVTADIVRTALADEDPYIRRAAWELSQRSNDPRLIDEARRALISDDNQMVRAVVEK